jgi:hypothetical protein
MRKYKAAKIAVRLGLVFSCILCGNNVEIVIKQTARQWMAEF